MSIAKYSVHGCEQKLHTIPSITSAELPEDSAMALIRNVCEVLRSVNPATAIKLCQGAKDSMIVDIFPIKLFCSITRQQSLLDGLVVCICSTKTHSNLLGSHSYYFLVQCHKRPLLLLHSGQLQKLKLK